MLRACIARIEQVNPKLNAVVQLCSDRAIVEARAADQSFARSELKGRCTAVPITIKDNLDTAVVSTGGTKGRKAFVPARDATVVTRLRGAGAILLGKKQHARADYGVRDPESCRHKLPTKTRTTPLVGQ